MNVILIAVVALIIIISLILVFVVLNMNSKNKQSEVNDNKSKNSNQKILDLDNVRVPRKIEEMNNHSLFQASKKVFDSFKSLDYANKPSSALDKVEWHSWQVSLLVLMLQTQKSALVPNNDSLFHHTIVGTDMTKVIVLCQKIIDKYVNNVNITRSRDELSKDIYWSSREVSILFYYMSQQSS